jgi:hypothetical protein
VVPRSGDVLGVESRIRLIPRARFRQRLTGPGILILIPNQAWKAKAPDSAEATLRRERRREPTSEVLFATGLIAVFSAET